MIFTLRDTDIPLPIQPPAAVYRPGQHAPRHRGDGQSQEYRPAQSVPACVEERLDQAQQTPAGQQNSVQSGQPLLLYVPAKQKLETKCWYSRDGVPENCKFHGGKIRPVTQRTEKIAGDRNSKEKRQYFIGTVFHGMTFYRIPHSDRRPRRPGLRIISSVSEVILLRKRFGIVGRFLKTIGQNFSDTLSVPYKPFL